MQMIVLAAFAVVLGLGSLEEPLLARAGWGVLSAMAAAYLLGAAGLTGLFTRSALRRLEGQDQPLKHVLRGHHRHHVFLHGWLLVGLTVLVGLGLCQQLRAVPGLGMVPLVSEGVPVGVFFLACLIFWRLDFRFEQAVRWQVEQDLMLAGRPVRPGWTAGQFVDFHVRHNFLFVAVPLGIILLVKDTATILATAYAPQLQELLGRWGWRVALSEVPAYVVGAATLPTAAVVFLLAPAILVHVWRTQRLGEGELRSRLERLCRQIGVRYREILVWKTGGVIVNAGVMGVHRSVRYVLISDALLEQMEDAQIVGVFGHEAGHVVHHHIANLAMATMAAILLCGTAAGVLGWLLPMPPGWEDVLMLVLLGAMWVPAFGWLSRRFERQADVFGAWCAGLDAEAHGAGYPDVSPVALGTPTLVAALENVARLNGMPREAHNWRHGSIAWRVGFLMDWAQNGGGRSEYDRRVRRLKLALWAALAAVVVLVVITWPGVL